MMRSSLFNSREAHWRILALSLSALCLLALTACSNAPRNSAQSSPPVLNAPPRTTYPMPPITTQTSGGGSPQGWTLLDNRRARLSDYLGHVVVLDFYATWCPPCRVEAPHLVELQRRYGQQGLHVVGLNVGGPDDRHQIPRFIEEFKIQYTLGFPDLEMTNLYLSDDDSIPQAFVFDRKGRLVKRFISYDDSMPAELERVVQAALAAGAD